ncbi:MAG: hypothetical protein ACR2NB_11640 [Solirubrobacteraceae bacterium]
MPLPWAPPVHSPVKLPKGCRLFVNLSYDIRAGINSPGFQRGKSHRYAP